MGKARGLSVVYLPRSGPPYPTLLEFFCRRFPRLTEEIWRERLESGGVHDEAGMAVGTDSPYLPDSRLFYRRQVAEEPVIPFAEAVVYEDEHLLVADKPPFLPVSPVGAYVAETLVERLRQRTGNDQLSPLHRIDRETSGLVLLAKSRVARGRYQPLFAAGLVRKTYAAISTCAGVPEWRHCLVENRIEQGQPWFRMEVRPGPVNARSHIHLQEVRNGRARLLLHPETGKKHQLRLHLSSLGLPLVGDRFYPILLPAGADDFQHPLQLLALRLELPDPFGSAVHSFESGRRLSLDDEAAPCLRNGT
jgi:tRNA pseudouridine32 synthase/23S rRNA pseudouridine746 synthase